MRILTSKRDCVEVDMFRNIDAFVVYTGYPNQDTIEGTDLIDEHGNGYRLSIEGETLRYAKVELTDADAAYLLNRASEYLSIHGSHDGQPVKDNAVSLFDEFEQQIGLTY